LCVEDVDCRVFEVQIVDVRVGFGDQLYFVFEGERRVYCGDED